MAGGVDGRLLTPLPEGGREDLAAYRQGGGFSGLERALQAGDAGALLREVEASRLRGRGGASFPVARKWQLAAEQEGAEKYVVANGGEHEPGSRKDRFLVERHPHKVLEGMLLCGHATGANKGYLYLIEDMEGPLASAEQALGELRSAGLLGKDIAGRGFEFDIQIHRAPTTYVAGEETAALDSIEGGPGKPREKPPYPGTAGLFGKPTTVNNVETLAHVAWIAAHGGEAFAAVGTEASTGTMLFTLPDEVQNPGVYEAPFGTTYRELIEGPGGGLRDGKTLRALLPALSCAFLKADQLDTPICYESLKALGTSPGCGGIHLFLDGDPVVPRVAEMAQFFMDEQCGQCPPCRMLTNQFVHILSGVADGKKGDYRGALDKIAGFCRGKGKCSLIEMAAAPVLSATEVFQADFDALAGE